MGDAQEQKSDAQPMEMGEFEALMKKSFKPKSDKAKDAITTAVATLAEQALAETVKISDDALKTIESMIAEIDRKLTEQINLIMHNADFTKLEGTWRGLAHLVNNTETDEMLRIRVMNISKKDLSKTLKKFKGSSWDQSPIFKKVYEEEYGTPGGMPYGCLIGDYEFSHGAQDIEILSGMAQVAAAAHSPFISAADPSLMNMDSWQELGDPRDLAKVFSTPEYAAWRSLRESDDSKYLALTMPRFLARTPYDPKGNPVDEFNFEEDTAGAAHDRFVWANSAYAMGTNITRAFKTYGWTSTIRGAESGGMVEGLPVHTFPTDDGGQDMKCPTEIAITDRREAELAACGLMPLSHWKNTDYAVFVGAQTLNKPAEFDDPDATANAQLGARLPYLFSSCRFAHYLKCIVRDKIGSFKERAEVQTWLNNWISKYVLNNVATASDADKARRPLAGAEVVVEEVEGNPGYYSAKFFLRPHYQLEGLSVSLRLVSKLPSAKGA